MAIRTLVGVAIVLFALPAGNVIAQGHDSDQRTITLVGCVMRESQFRDMYGPGASGPRGAGIGGRNEYMLVDAHEVGAGGTNPGITPATTGGTCPPAPGTFPTAYEMTGKREGELAPFNGRRVEVTGIQKEAHVRPVGTSGIDRPTGGFDPLGHELHLFEVEVQSAREPAAYAEAPAPAPAPVAEAAPAPVEQPATPAPEPPVAAAPPAPAPEPEPAPAPEQQAAAPAPEAPAAPVEEGRVARELPRSASPLPLTGLIGLLSLAAGAGLRRLRRRA